MEELKQKIENLQSQIDELKQKPLQSEEQFIDVKNIRSMFETINETSGTTKLDQRKIVPKTIYEQVFVYYDSTGPTWKLYIYDYSNKVWKSVTIA